MNRAFLVEGSVGAGAPPPVPSPTRDSQVVAPDDLARGRWFVDRLAVGDGVERFISSRDDQPRRPDICVEILPTDRHQMQHGHGVVDVGQPVDAGSPSEARRNNDSTLLRASAGA